MKKASPMDYRKFYAKIGFKVNQKGNIAGVVRNNTNQPTPKNNIKIRSQKS